MTAIIDSLLSELQDKELKMLIDGLDLLDEYYSTKSMPDNVLNTRILKQTLRDYKQILN
jgi:hypothetical protein|tara:strand:- start:359 stop:535 length:177 start_codon:yes stop_codon:yes gene_type:complete